MSDKKARGSKFDQNIYGDGAEYAQTIGEVDDREADVAAKLEASQRKNAHLAGVHGMKQLIEETKLDGEHENAVLGGLTAEQELFKSRKIVDREDEYHQGRLRRGRMMSPERKDFFSNATGVSDSGKSGNSMQAPTVPQKRSYQQIMQAQLQQNEEIDAARELKKAQEQGTKSPPGSSMKRQRVEEAPMPTVTIKTHGRPAVTTAETASEWEADDNTATMQPSRVAPQMARMGSNRMVVTSSIRRDEAAGGGSTHISQKWDTPRRPGGLAGSSFGATPRRNRWDVSQGGATPGSVRGGFGATPSRFSSLKQVNGDNATPSRFSVATPMRGQMMSAATPKVLSRFGDTAEQSLQRGTRWDQKVSAPANNMDTQSQFSLADSQSQSQFTMIDTSGRQQQQPTFIDERNMPMTDEDLDKILPSSGYEPPEGYVSEHQLDQSNPASNLVQTQGAPGSVNVSGYALPDAIKINEDAFNAHHGAQLDKGDLPFIKPEDVSHFSALLGEADENQLSQEEIRDRKIMMLLLKIKNGTPPMRKSALKTITEKAREFGAGPLFNQILPLLMSPSLEDQERHLLVKVIDRILYKLDELVRPYVHKILVVIEPLLIDEDYYARVEGREIISNLAKAAGLATMIATMRPDIDHSDEYVRNTTARAFSVIASALGIPTILPFLRAVCISKKSWRARHTGIKIVQQIAILMGCAVLPHLKNLVDIIEHGLKDEEQKVKTITALALSALAEAANPYGIEAFDSVLVPLMDGISQYRGKALAAFLKAIGFVIPLMDSDHAGEFTQFLTPVLIREFTTNDDEMKKIVLKVVKQAVATEGVKVLYVREEIIPEFFSNFWVRRNALDKKNYKQLIETTAEIALKVGGAEIIKILEPELKDENEQYRKILMETVEKIVSNQGVADVNAKLEEKLMDGILFCFQEQSTEDSNVVLNAFGTVVNCLGIRTKPYISQMCGIIQWRLNNRSARVRQQAADLIQRIAVVMKMCDQEILMGRLGVILYEYLGEEYPEVLGSILGALKAIVNVIGMTQMTPPIKDLLPRLTPILKNRHEKVQENCIDLVGRIADRGAEYVSAREWMRICFDLLDLLKAHKKGIRRATVNTFGYIAKAIGPQDVLATLLNNLRVQERQNRVCTTVAIAIVAETCGPFTVLPALMNEYRVPEMNVQNGVLKSLSFMFEYIGEMGKDYIYAVTPLLEDALIDRDLVHRQTASSAVKHLSLGVAYMGCEDALQHLLNYLFPNIFEISPHVINAVMEGIEGLRVALGPGRILLYTLQGLFHPARRVREVYWKIYNNMYLGAQDSLVAIYPTFPDDPKTGNTYRRHELELMM